jgi:anti-sigma factor RsiW
MSDCRSLAPLVTPYVDGEIAAADRETLEQHLRVCPPCEARVASERAVRELLTARRSDLCETHAPAALVSRCGEAARLAARGHQAAAVSSSTSIWARRLAPLALAATLVLIVGAAFLYQLTARSATVLAAELAADHMKCFALNSLLGTHHAQGVVESALAAGFGWRARLPATGGSGLELVGGRPCLYGEGKIAHVMYRYNGQPLSLFMLPGTQRTATTLAVLGHEAAIWSAEDRTFVVVAREHTSDMERLIAEMRDSVQ